MPEPIVASPLFGDAEDTVGLGSLLELLLSLFVAFVSLRVLVGTRDDDETEQEQTALVGRGFGLTGCRCFGFLRGLVNRLTVNNVYCRFELQILFLVRRYVGR